MPDALAIQPAINPNFASASASTPTVMRTMLLMSTIRDQHNRTFYRRNLTITPTLRLTTQPWNTETPNPIHFAPRRTFASGARVIE